MKQGFSLIELLVVVAIIGVMMAGAVLTVSGGRDMAHVREASRGVAQMVHYANALALLRQRPVVLSYTVEKTEEGMPVVRLDVRLSGESMASMGDAKPADPIYREVDGEDTESQGAEAAQAEAEENAASDDEKTVATETGAFFTRQILNPEELAKEDATRTFEGMTVELELLGEDGAAVDDRTAASLKEQAQGLLRNRSTAIKAWSSQSGRIDTDAKEEAQMPEKDPDHVIFETNGSCQPHRVTLRTAADEDKPGAEGLVITVSRSGKVVVGESEEEKK